jgi:hypothetical protein
VNRLFLDANVLFSAAYGRDAGCARLWRLRGVALMTSRYAFEEARRHLDGERLERLAFFGGRLQIVAEAPVARLPHGIGPYFGRRLGGVLALRPRDYLSVGREPSRPARKT